MKVKRTLSEKYAFYSLISTHLYGIVATVLAIIALLIGLGYFKYLSANSETVKPMGEKSLPENKPDVVPQKSAPPKMVYISGGEFVMGREGGNIAEAPAHKVTVKSFYMDVYEVTNEDYEKFVRAENYKSPAIWKNGKYEVTDAKKPVTGINWGDANAYAKWAGKRLPTEEEWEFAARGTDGRLYPWGDVWQENLANVNKVQTNEKAGQPRTVEEQRLIAIANSAPVGEFKGVSPFGLYDMVGNVWEWTSSDFKPYPNGRLDGKKNQLNEYAAALKVLRGGNFGSERNDATTTNRIGYPARNLPLSDYYKTGFRCVKDLTQ